MIHVRAEDTGDEWYVSMGPENTKTSREGTAADLTLTAAAADLYLRLWNRSPDSSITMLGNTDVMDLWHEKRPRPLVIGRCACSLFSRHLKSRQDSRSKKAAGSRNAVMRCT